MKWALMGAALIAVIAVAVAVTAVVLRSGSGSGSGGDKASTSDIASANDTGPVTIITSEPTCAQFMPINNALAAQENKGWADRDPSIPANQWSAEQRAQYEEIASAWQNTADQYVALAKQTPHRVIRELYEQSIAYARAYANSIPKYTEQDEQLARTFLSASNTIVNICEAITYGSAGSRSLLSTPTSVPSLKMAPSENVTQPAEFLSSGDSICPQWIAALTQAEKDLSEWSATSATIPASQWTPEQREIYESAGQTMISNADQANQLSTQTGNPVLQDILALVATYKTVYAKTISTYVAADGYLASVGNKAGNIVYNACLAVGG